MQIISHWEMFIRNSSCSIEINTTGMLLLVTDMYCEPSVNEFACSNSLGYSRKNVFTLGLPLCHPGEFV